MQLCEAPETGLKQAETVCETRTLVCAERVHGFRAFLYVEPNCLALDETLLRWQTRTMELLQACDNLQKKSALKMSAVIGDEHKRTRGMTPCLLCAGVWSWYMQHQACCSAVKHSGTIAQQQEEEDLVHLRSYLAANGLGFHATLAHLYSLVAGWLMV